jgi:sigma-E factor negative regulatory protein RseA
MNPESLNARTSQHPDGPRSSLSALADGQDDALAQACSLWRDDEASRQAWHTYHLIGDVLRSDELASSPARDAAFLDRLRSRLAAEPVVLAPQPLPVPPSVSTQRRLVWRVPAAMAAGFVAVAGVLMVTRMGAGPGDPSGAVIAESQGVVGPGVRLVVSPPVQAPAFSGNATFIRDPRLDQYLRAHQAARGGSVMTSPEGLMRRVDAVAPASSAQR